MFPWGKKEYIYNTVNFPVLHFDKATQPKLVEGEESDDDLAVMVTSN